MGFAENLKQIRKQKGISQEELADMLDVSRQAVSKWEQGDGFLEVEKLLILSKKLNVSLDYLMADSIASYPKEAQYLNNIVRTGRISILSFDKKSLVNCYKVSSSNVFKTKKDEPKYALFGVDSSSFWGDNSIVLGWYDSEDKIREEIKDIMHAINNGDASYELKYAVNVKWHWGKNKNR